MRALIRLVLVIILGAGTASAQADKETTAAKIALANRFLENEGAFDFMNKGAVIARHPAIDNPRLFATAYRAAILRRRPHIDQTNKAYANHVAQILTFEQLKVLVHDQEKPVMQSVRMKRISSEGALLEGLGESSKFTKPELEAMHQHMALVQSLYHPSSPHEDEESGARFVVNNLRIVAEMQLEALTNYCKMGGNCHTDAFRKSFPKIHP